MEFSAGQIAALLGGKLIGNANAMVSDVAPIESAEARHLAFITDEKYLHFLKTTRAGVVLINEGLAVSGYRMDKRLSLWRMPAGRWDSYCNW